jgi:HK97 family phage major capsid protein
MPLAWQYLGYSQQEFAVSNLVAADENAKAFYVNRMATLADEFVEGSGTGECKGIQAYATTTTDEAGKLRLIYSGDDDPVVAADLRAAIVTARNLLPVGRRVAVMNGSTKTILENEQKASGESYFSRVNGVLMYQDCEVAQNDNMPDIGASTDVAVLVMLAGRGYGVGINPRMVLSSNDTGSKRNLYMGQGMGGAIVDHAAIYGIAQHASA